MINLVLRGEIREGHIVIGAAGPEPAEDIALTVTRIFADGTSSQEQVSYPGDFTAPAPWADDRPEDGTGALRLPVGEAPAAVPLQRVEVAAQGAELEFSSFWDLDRLYPSDTKAFKALMFRAIHRPKSDHTQAFLTGQILDHYDLDVSHRCVSAVIYGYRSIEFGEAAMIARAIHEAEALLEASDSLPENDHPRRGRQLLRSSLFTILWQLWLASGDRPRLAETLERYVAEVLGNSRAAPVICVNFVPAALLLGYMRKQENQPGQAREILLGAYRYYRAKFADLPDNPTHFYEFSKPFQAAAVCRALVEVLDGKDWPGIPKTLGGPRQILELANRVNEPEAARRMEKNFFAMIKETSPKED